METIMQKNKKTSFKALRRQDLLMDCSMYKRVKQLNRPLMGGFPRGVFSRFMLFCDVYVVGGVCFGW